MHLDLPVGLDDVWLEATSIDVAADVTGVVITPKSVVPRHARRDVGRVRSAQAIGDQDGAFLFFMDLNTFVEPNINWVRGARVSELLVSPADSSRVRVVIRNGGADNRITVTAADHTEQLDLSAWETRELELPVPPGGDLIPISIHPEGGFVPAEVESGSTDTRLLGCQVTVVLE